MNKDNRVVDRIVDIWQCLLLCVFQPHTLNVKRNEGDTWDFTVGNYGKCPSPRHFFYVEHIFIVVS